MRSTILIALLGALIAGFGLPRLVVDGQRAFALPEGHPLPALNEVLDTQTGGDDLIAVLLRSDAGGGEGLDPDLLDAVDAVRAALDTVNELEHVRDPLSAPVLADRDGAITAVTPFHPRPSEGAEWTAASAALLADPFVRDQLLAADGRAAVVVGWIARGGADGRVVRAATGALVHAEFRGSPAGREVQEQVNGARMAVALGEVEGTADDEVGRRLALLATGTGPAAAMVAGWQRDAAAAADDPAAVALSRTREALGGVTAGVTLDLVGPAVTQQALADAIPRGIGSTVAALGLMVGLLVGLRRRALAAVVAGALGPGLALGLSFGAFGLLGIPLQVPTVLAGLVAAAWAGALVGAASYGGLVPAGVHVFGLLAAAAWGAGLGPAGAGAAPLVALCAGSIVSAVLSPLAAGPALSSGEGGVRWWGIYAAIAVTIVAGLCLKDVPRGLDAGRLVSEQHPVGEASSAMSRILGTSPAAFGVYFDDAQPRALTTPGALRAIRVLQDSMRVQPAVRGTRSWSDFVGELHHRMAGAEPGTLPTTTALVQQYLLTFGRKDDMRSLVSADQSVGVAFVRMEPGGAADLGRLSELWPAGEGPLALAGDAVSISLAARLSSTNIVCASGVAWLLAAFALLGLPAARSPRRAFTESIAVAAPGLAGAAVAACHLGSVAPTVCAAGLVGGALGGACRALPRAGAWTACAAIVGLAPLLVSPATELAAFAAGLLAASAVAAAGRLADA